MGPVVYAGESLGRFFLFLRGGDVMEKYYAGIMVRQRAIDWWPYLKKVIDKGGIHLAQVALMVACKNLYILHKHYCAPLLHGTLDS